MKLRLIKPVVITGHPGIKPGDIFEEKHPGHLLGAGYCEEVKDEAPPRFVEEIETRTPAIESRDPQPKRTSRKLP